MIFFKRRRLLIWLLKAYLKKWGKSIVISFVLGLIIFSVLFLNRRFILSKIPFTNTQSVGIAGIYLKQDLPNNLPDVILNKASRGLTKISPDGKVLPDIASSWDVKDDGKTFIFFLKQNIYFADGKPLDSSTIEYNFSDVTIERPTKYSIIFKLKDRYSPFLVTLANHKVFKKNSVGVSDYQISKIKVNGGFVDYIELYSKSDKKNIKYDFYDSQEALKNAYVLGEVSQILDINSLSYQDNKKLSDFQNTLVSRSTNSDKIVTIFLNQQDPLLSDKKIRKALAYSLPDSFSEGKKAEGPYPPSSWANSSFDIYQKDLKYAKSLLSQSDASKSGKIKIELKTLPQYKDLADSLANYWKPLSVETKVEVVDGVPTFYQAFLGEMPVLKDPDLYTFWHSGQTNNITNYKSLRIDKLLEDGRRTTNTQERKRIYADFQKYLLDDAPAIFLYFPYTYTLTRK